MSPAPDRALLAERSAAIERHLGRVAPHLPRDAAQLLPETAAADTVILHLWQAAPRRWHRRSGSVPSAPPTEEGAPVSKNSAATPTADLVAALADRLGRDQVFGTPVTQGTTTLVPVARVRAGGGLGGRAKRRPDQANGGVGFVARPAGAWKISADGGVEWHPAVDVNRIVLGGQIALAAVLIAAFTTRGRGSLVPGRLRGAVGR